MGCAFIYIFFVRPMCIMLLDAIAMYFYCPLTKDEIKELINS